jgi:glucose uptake protein GlcU
MGSASQIMTAMTAMASLGVAVFFLRFWRQTQDRLFGFFALAFALMGINWIALAQLHALEGTRHLVYVVRLIAFILIIVGIIDKSRGGSAGR